MVKSFVDTVVQEAYTAAIENNKHNDHENVGNSRFPLNFIQTATASALGTAIALEKAGLVPPRV